jgi:hypothetical protein
MYCGESNENFSVTRVDITEEGRENKNEKECITKETRKEGNPFFASRRILSSNRTSHANLSFFSVSH